MNTPAKSPRLLHIDWARGLAVLWMIRGHALESFLSPAYHQGRVFHLWQMSGGYTAPAFLFLAGLSVGLSYAKIDQMEVSFARRLWLSVRRGLEVLGIAYLFRIGGYLEWYPLSKVKDLFRFDILNNIGLSLVLLGLLLSLVRREKARYAVLAAAFLLTALAAPAVWGSAAVNSLPYYIRNVFNSAVEFGHFPLFPFFAFMPAGAIVGLLLRRNREDLPGLRSLHLALAGIGLLLILGGLWAARAFSHGPAWIFFYNSPEYTFLRTGLQAMTLTGSFFLCLRFKPESFSFMRLMGRHSLLLYWAHILICYGRLTSRWQKHLNWPQALAMMLAVMALMVLLAWAVENWGKVKSSLSLPFPAKHTK